MVVSAHGLARNAGEDPRIRERVRFLKRAHSVTQFAYLAGLIDGDGYIGVRRRVRAATKGDRARRTGYHSMVKIGGETKHISALRIEFGRIGNVHIRKREGQRHLAEWCITDGVGVSVLIVVVAHLRLKRRQAELVIDMPRPRSRWGATPEVRDLQEWTRSEVQRLNQGGRGKKAA